MNNVSSLKSAKNETPKTPGGISKSLLTPCRRVGLSRSWKKAGPSPFISPLSGGSSSSNVKVEVEKKSTRKRKKSIEHEENQEESESSPKTPITTDSTLEVEETDVSVTIAQNEDLSSTPTCHVEIPRKKKSKSLLSALNKKEKVVELHKELSTEIVPLETDGSKENLSAEKDNVESTSKVAKVQKSRSKNKISPKNSSKTRKDLGSTIESEEGKEDITSNSQIKTETINSKPKSPNELTKECIVVIQKKIFKTNKETKITKNKDDVKSQVLFDSDSDDVPLCQLNTNNIEQVESSITAKEKVPSSKAVEIISIDDDEDFIEIKGKIKKLEDKATSMGGLKKKTNKNNVSKVKKPLVIPNAAKNADFDDDEDFDFDNKKTILIHKTYEKVRKPERARSTGSITQKDIDDLKARIEAKKNLLLAKAMTEDTAELRSWIKKWQKGCQDALMELMELMMKKFPERQNMDYSEMLSMLKIPANLVGYDAENDCFNTPDDSNIILSKFNDL